MKQVLNIAYYEVRHILKDHILLLLVAAVPLFYAALFGAAFISGVLKDIPTGVVDLDNSTVSREIVTAYKNSPYFKVLDQIQTYPQLEEAMRQGTVRSGIVIPEGFSSDLAHRRSNEVLIVYDGSNLIWGYNVRKNALDVITDFNAGHSAAYLAGMGMAEHEIANTLDSISLNYEVWYNPTYSYVNFLFMGILIMIIHQVGLLTSSLTVTREKEKNSWIQFLSSPIARWKIFAGKCLPYFVANTVNYCLLLWIAANIMQAKVAGSLALVFLLGLLFNLFIVSAGFFISLHAPNSLQVTRYLLPMAFPIFMISGFTWPKTHIPAAINGLAKLLPFTWMAEGFRMVTLKELGLAHVLPNLLALSAMAALTLFFALTFDKKRKPPKTGDLSVNCQSSVPTKGNCL
ncbi:ABC transporter permease [Desulfofalx alkaliphila]|uniref:ABC transporter permease n=1 Tax=Desulfofalx alkaliphila TaxID=105483 RepID=UPI0004E1F52B|nr:ABC transporter permease [Desulfofalx alkaliphila]